MINRPNWGNTKQRYELWWEEKRPIVQVTAKHAGGSNGSLWDGWNLVHDLEHPEEGIEAFERHCEQTYFGGEAFPNLFINLGPGVMASYVGAEPQILPDTVWFETPKDWEKLFNEVEYNQDNKWWNITKSLTSKAVEISDDKFIVGMTDLGGSLDILASSRGTESLLFDLIDHPDLVMQMSKTLNELWFRYYDELDNILQEKNSGSTNWMGIWSSKKWYPLQCDFSAMISPKRFEQFVAPYLQEQCQWLDRSIYHWDGPGQIPHLDILLDIPELNGIQWTPGAGEESIGSPKWYPLYKRIQEKGKLLVLLGVDAKDIEALLKEVSTEGLLISTGCNTAEEADNLLANIQQWTVV